MELYLITALLFMYILTVSLGDVPLLHRLWTMAFIVSFLMTAVSLLFLRISKQDVMVAADEFNWYNILYVCGALMVAVGVINLWMYRHQLKELLFPVKQKSKE